MDPLNIAKGLGYTIELYLTSSSSSSSSTAFFVDLVIVNAAVAAACSRTSNATLFELYDNIVSKRNRNNFLSSARMKSFQTKKSSLLPKILQGSCDRTKKKYYYIYMLSNLCRMAMELKRRTMRSLILVLVLPKFRSIDDHQDKVPSVPCCKRSGDLLVLPKIRSIDNHQVKVPSVTCCKRSSDR
ncbi:hypothetical protein FF38_11470 [Lucilia cuprina]|uniref:Uncharacterized protein n=1 Tax=Lucilia cuprina TaxID=7375 RepID=A0A0L0CNM2_LUCCU|nr:hypothetical protein FF38_11470 [Lucilia cuprina]